MSWDPNTAAATFPYPINLAVWSPCNRFIAITFEDSTVTVEILDPVTFQRLQTLEPPEGMIECNTGLIFSPDSHILTCSGRGSNFAGVPSWGLFIVSWDLQTGGIASVIRWPVPEKVLEEPSMTYSADGKMVGVFYQHYEGTNAGRVFICNVASGVCMYSHSLNNDISLSHNIWTCGETLQFVTVDAMTITIWEVGFISDGTPMKVGTLPTPDNFDLPIVIKEAYPLSFDIEFLPIPCRLAFVFEGEVWVWDVQNSKYLLHCTDTKFYPGMSFSSNGCFFACEAKVNIYLWKESSTGYVLHKILESRAIASTPLLSQNGESVVVFSECTVQLWHTNGFATHPSSISTQTHQPVGYFLLDFSPDGTLAIVTMRLHETVTVLNLKSSIPQLTIDAGVGVCGLSGLGTLLLLWAIGKSSLGAYLWRAAFQMLGWVLKMPLR
jgi:hypothetical protein